MFRYLLYYCNTIDNFSSVLIFFLEDSFHYRLENKHYLCWKTCRYKVFVSSRSSLRIELFIFPHIVQNATSYSQRPGKVPWWKWAVCVLRMLVISGVVIMPIQLKLRASSPNQGRAAQLAAQRKMSTRASSPLKVILPINQPKKNQWTSAIKTFFEQYGLSEPSA